MSNYSCLQQIDLTFIYSVRAKLRAAEEGFDWLSSYHARCFYAKYEPNADHLESGYLKSPLLIRVRPLFSDYWHASYLMFIQVYKAIFTSPSSAMDISEEDNAENIPPAKSQRTSSGNKPTRRDVASRVNLNNKVTPRSVAYAAVMVGFLLYMLLYAYM